MAILGVGVDLVHVPRIISFLQRRGSRLPRRILSKEEYDQWLSLPTFDILRRSRFLAVRWGIKEAAYKAMYPIARPSWKELTYRSFEKGLEGSKPGLLYHPADTTKLSKIGPTHISVTHDGEYVFASVTIEFPKF